MSRQNTKNSLSSQNQKFRTAKSIWTCLLSMVATPEAMEWRGHRCDPSGRFVGPGWRTPLQRYVILTLGCRSGRRATRSKMQTSHERQPKECEHFLSHHTLVRPAHGGPYGTRKNRRRCWRAADVPWLVITSDHNDIRSKPVWCRLLATVRRCVLLISSHLILQPRHRTATSSPLPLHITAVLVVVRGRPLRRLHLHLGSLAESKGPINHWFCIDEWQTGDGRFRPK